MPTKHNNKLNVKIAYYYVRNLGLKEQASLCLTVLRN
jgi:hypothetical protein